MYVELLFLFSAHRLIMVNICTKFHENILNGIRVMERTRKINGRTDGQTDGRTDGRRARHNTTRLRRAYKKDNLKVSQKYRTISLISQSSKVMLKVIFNRLRPEAEEMNAEEQAGFRAGRSTTEHRFNLRILCEKYHQHQQNLSSADD